MALANLLRRLFGRSLPARDNPFAELRSRALTMPRNAAGIPEPASRDAVWGVMVEWYMGTEVALLALCDGTSSMYLGFGGGVIGGHARESVREAGATLLRECEGIRHLATPALDSGPPAKGQFRITLRTDACLLRAETPERDASTANSTFYGAYNASQRFFAAMSWKR